MGYRYGWIQVQRQYWQASLHIQLYFSLSLCLVASFFPAFRQLLSPWPKYGTSAQDCILIA